MSMRALLTAVRNRLRAAITDVPPGLGYETRQCEVGWDGQPPPMAGQVFVAVHPGSITSQSDQAMDEYYDLTVTLSMRLGQFPVDRWGERSLILSDTGLYARAEAIRALLHMNYPVQDAANAIIGAQDNGFVETIRYLGMGALREQGPDWWWAESEQQTEAPVGLSVEIRLGKARRVQVVEEQS